MIRNTVPHLLFITFIFLFLFNYPAYSSWGSAQDGDKIILIRHSIAPGSGDPPGFQIKDCKTQRNLSQEGIDQSKRIGKLFKKNKIKIDQVLSSQWCRCKDTARYAFKSYEEFSALNSTYQASFAKNEAKQIKIIKNFINAWNGKEGNLILVTHYSIITAITDAIPRSGEIVITDKKFKVLGTHLIQ